ncbi:MAG: DNA-binding protein YbiB [Burkholderiales bacterium]|jgi:anthranilate phosphoribosyltransferase|nr:DNA-binding protein YbiB [Burkholderiales bacterium]
MPFTPYLKAVCGDDERRGLDESEAHDLFSAMLDAGVPDLELGALLVLLRHRGETVDELLGFMRATGERMYAIPTPAGPLRPVVFPAYGGALEQPSLLPLLALMLQRLGVPVLVHGTLEGGRRVAAAYVFRELGVMPSANGAALRAALESDHLAFAPTALLSPGLASLLALKHRLGVRTSAHLVAKLIDPFGADSVLLVSASTPSRLAVLEATTAALGATALVMRSAEGEPVAGASARPRIVLVRDGGSDVLFDEERTGTKTLASLPSAFDVAGTATWTRAALAGETPIPHPLVNQLACCLFACGYTDDFHQAKAIAAVEAGGLGTGGAGARGRGADRGASRGR